MSGINVKNAILPAASEGSLNQLLEKLYYHAHVDFRHYKVSSVSRRIDRRLRATGSASYQQYCDFLDLNPDEYDRLLEDLTINVTEFFRDDTPWHLLNEVVFPDLVSKKSTADETTSLRIWSAGCATGQETYSAAIALDEAVRAMDASVNIDVYGTDIDTGSLSVAQKGQYKPELFAGMNRERIDRYFDSQSCIEPSIRKHIHFLRHDLVLDEPLKDVDMVLCRNVAIYFSRQLQDRLFMNFYRCLRKGGYLFLGKAESLFGEIGKKFTVINSTWKIYQKQ